MGNKTAVNIDISTTIIMTLVFLLLKCVGVIDWSWWWVFTPCYVSIGLLAIAFVVFGLSNIVSYILTSFQGRSGGGDAV